MAYRSRLARRQSAGADINLKVQRGRAENEDSEVAQERDAIEPSAHPGYGDQIGVQIAADIPPSAYTDDPLVGQSPGEVTAGDSVTSELVTAED